MMRARRPLSYLDQDSLRYPGPLFLTRDLDAFDKGYGHG